MKNIKEKKYLICNTKMFRFLIFALFVFYIQIANADTISTKTLTKSELDLIEQYAKLSPIGNNIGQLFMVGMPADFNTALDTGSKYLDKVIIDAGIGFAVVNGYTYYDDKKLSDKEYVSKIINFNNTVQEKTHNSKSKIPLLIASDFEGPSYTSIKRGLEVPPSALSLASTQNGEAIFAVGAAIGYQLQNVGIQILLGPVLDVYNVQQGTRNTLRDRSFASSNRGVFLVASHFVGGVKQSDTSMFAKHYPNHGAIETNPHWKTIPIFEESNDTRLSQLKIYESLLGSLDGVMSAHIAIENNENPRIATVSRPIIQELVNSTEDSKIIVTDDLSEMGAVILYMEKNKLSYEELVIQAFDAGHDVFLFAHCFAEKEKNKHKNKYLQSKFTIDDLFASINKLTTYVLQSQKNTQQFRKSLFKVLKLKAMHAKSKGISVEEFIKFSGGSFFHIGNDGNRAIQLAESSLLETYKANNIKFTPEESGNILRNTMRSAIDKSAIVISSEGNSYALDSFPSHTKVLAAVYEEGFDEFRDTLKKFKDSEVLLIPLEKNSPEFRKLEESLKGSFNKFDKLIYTVYDESDADLLQRLFVRNKSEFKAKTIILAHNSPSILNCNLLYNSTIVATFTKHPYSFLTDIDLLTGKIEAGPLKRLPIDIGESGKFYSVKDTTEWVEQSTGTTYKTPSIQTSMNEQYINAARKDYILIDRRFSTFGLLSLKFITPFVLSSFVYFLGLSIPEKCSSKNKFLSIISKLLSGNHRKFLLLFLSLMIFIIFMFLLFYSEEFKKIIGLISSVKKDLF